MPAKGYRKPRTQNTETIENGTHDQRERLGLSVLDKPVPDDLFKLYFLAGDSHVNGRMSPPLRFFPDAYGLGDPRPYALVRRDLGDWLIHGERTAEGEARYEWSPDALSAFSKE